MGLDDQGVVGDEDCLHLNVFTPRIPRGSKGRRRALPVMVWFHGGNFKSGSGNLGFVGELNVSNSLDPQSMVNDHQVVLVTGNFRLGILGFLSVNQRVSGNQGLRDQELMLEWVHQNIDHFGGDPDQVTIFGHESGGVSVSIHMLNAAQRPGKAMPCIKETKLTVMFTPETGLFVAGISQSGTVLSYSEPLRQATSKTSSLAAIELFNCSASLFEVNHVNMDQELDCLRRTNAAELVAKTAVDLHDVELPPLPLEKEIEDELRRTSIFVGREFGTIDEEFLQAMEEAFEVIIK